MINAKGIDGRIIFYSDVKETRCDGVFSGQGMNPRVLWQIENILARQETLCSMEWITWSFSMKNIERIQVRHPPSPRHTHTGGLPLYGISFARVWTWELFIRFLEPALWQAARKVITNTPEHWKAFIPCWIFNASQEKHNSIVHSTALPSTGGSRRLQKSNIYPASSFPCSSQSLQTNVRIVDFILKQATVAYFRFLPDSAITQRNYIRQ